MRSQGILERAKRPYEDLETCISALALMCVSVNVFVSVHGRVYVCVFLNLDSLRQGGPEKGLLGRHGWGLQTSCFLTPLVLF